MTEGIADTTLIPPDERDRLARVYPAPSDMTEADAKLAADDLAKVQTLRRWLDVAKGEACAPHRDRLEELRRIYDPLIAAVQAAEARVKGIILEWRRYRELSAARAAREAVQAEAAWAATQARQDAEAAGLPAATVEAIAGGVQREVEDRVGQQIAPAPLPRATAGEAGTAVLMRTWHFEVVDPALVPREHLIVDAVGIGRLVRGGLRDGADGTPAIPGVRIFARDGIAGRRR